MARELGIPHGGWCPRGRLAEDGPIDNDYLLQETASADPAKRTRRNVRDSDGTLIVAEGDLRGGTALTRRCAERLGRPLLVVSGALPGDVAAATRWVLDHRIETLNVAGPRASQWPRGYEVASRLLRALLGRDTIAG